MSINHPLRPLTTQTAHTPRIVSSNNPRFEYNILHNAYRNITLDELASECNMSLSCFKCHFRKVYGESPHRWLLTQRLQRARHLLLCSDLQIKNIAYECGFATPSSFIRIFRKRFGTTPGGYRANHQRMLMPKQEG